MAEYFCDHGLYAESAAFTASVSGTTLTVSAVSSGRIGVGSRVTCASFTDSWPVIVTAFGTGAGGTGTYTISHNRNGTISSTSMTSVDALPLSVPIWGVAQDGDGKAIGAATPATAEVVFTGIPSSGAIAVLGVTLTPTWATSADTCANNLAAAINAATGTATGPASFTGKSQVRNHLYARGPATGAPAGTCQIMTRQGSADHNGLIAVTHTLNNVSSAGTINFAGGASGAWGWLTNAYAMWPSGIGGPGAIGYGVFNPTLFCGSRAGGDTIHIRRRGRIILSSNTSNLKIQPPVVGSITSYLSYKIDRGDKWPSDSLATYISLERYGAYSLSAFLGIEANGYAQFVVFDSWRGSDTDHKLRFLDYNGDALCGVNPGAYVVRGCHFYASAVAAPTPYGGTSNNTNSSHVFEDCRFSRYAQSAAGYQFLPQIGGSGQWRLTFSSCIFDCGTPTAPQTNEIQVLTSSSNNLLELNGCKFIGYLAGSSAIQATTNTSGTRQILGRNNDFGNLSVAYPAFQSAVLSGQYNARGVNIGVLLTSHNGRHFLSDSPIGCVAWSDTASQPTLNAKLRDGVTPWSLMVCPPLSAGNISAIRPLETPRFAKLNTLDTGTRTITVEFGVESTLSLTAADVSLQVEYEDADGPRAVSTDIAASGALIASTASWTNASGAQFTFSKGGTLYFNKYKISVTTPTAILGANHPDGILREIGVVFRVHKNVANTNQMLFVDPEVQVV